HQRRGLLVAHLDEAHLIAPLAQRLHDSIDAVTGKPEDDLDAPILKSLDHDVGRGRCHGIALLRRFDVGASWGCPPARSASHVPTRGGADIRARKGQKRRAERTRSARAYRSAARRALNDLHGKNASRRSNAQVKRRCPACSPVDSFALSLVSRAEHRWHMRCSLTDRSNEKEKSHEAASHARRYDGRRSARGPRGGARSHDTAAAGFDSSIG